MNGKLKEINDLNNTPIGAPPAAGENSLIQEEIVGATTRSTEEIFYEVMGF